MTWSWVDLLLALLIFGRAVVGWRRGVIGTALSFVGLVIGAGIAIVLVPLLPLDAPVVQQFPVLRVVLPLGLLAVLASVGYRLGAATGVRSRADRRDSRVGRRGAYLLSSALGSALSVLVICVLAWSVGVAIRGAAPPGLAASVERSAVLRTIDGLIPSGASRVVVPLQQALDREGFPRVFDGIGFEHIRDVAPPQASGTGSAAIREAGASVLKVRATSSACRLGQEGTGWVARGGVVVTNAHVVAGADRVSVQTARGRAWTGEVVAFDPRRDVAVIRVENLPLRPLPVGQPLSRGDEAVVAGYPWDGPYRVGPVRVRERILARGADIRGVPGVAREIYALRGTVRPGNSGGPLLSPAGDVVGVVFARSSTDPDTGYALTMAEVAPALARARASSSAVSTGACAA